MLARQQEEGVDRQLVGFEMIGRGIARQGYEVLAGGETVGRVTSGSFSPTLQKAIGMAYVPTALATAGTELEIQIRKNRVPAVTVPIPFYKRGQ